MVFEKACRSSSRSVLAVSIVSILSVSSLSAETMDRRSDYEEWIEHFVSNGDAVSLPWFERADSSGKRISAGAGGTIVVENCDDAGPGSLRQAFLDAVDGTVIDATHLTDCPDSKITLLTGELYTSADVTLRGPGKELLEITADYNSRVIAGKYLNIGDVTISRGLADRAGGCVFAAEDLVLYNAGFWNCGVVGSDATAPDALGGALYSAGDVFMRSSLVFSSDANTDVAGGSAYGGGLYAKGDIDVQFSRLSLNRAFSDSGNAAGGALFTRGSATIYDSFIGGNTALTMLGDGAGGGVRAQTQVSVAVSRVSNNSVRSAQGSSRGGGISAPMSFMFASTFARNEAVGICDNCVISGGAVDSPDLTRVTYSNFISNHAWGYNGGPNQRVAGGAVAVLGSGQPAETSEISNTTFYHNYTDYHAGATGLVYGGAIATRRPVTISSSTIAGNSATQRGGGLSISVPAGSPPPTLISVILANNEANLGGDVAAIGNPAMPYVISGSHNLVLAADSDVVLPADTLVSDPHLRPLSTQYWNAQWNYYLPLAPDSPAIDHGVATSQFDQRLCWYARDSGNAPDIGAFEVQFDRLDNIFGHGFETALPSPCPAAPP